MGRYGFTSPGAAGGNAIEQFLIQRAMQARAEQQMAMQQQAQQQQADQQQAELALRQQQEARQADAQAASQRDLANSREFTRAGTIAESAMPGDRVDEATRALLEKQGYGGQVQKTPGVMVPLLGTSQASDATVQPEGYEMRGGSKYLAQQEAERSRSEAASAARQAADERAAADRTTREEIARLSHTNTSETQGLRNDLLRAQTAAAQDKLDAGRQARTDAASAVSGTRAEVRDLAQSLLNDPALEGITGSIEGRRNTFFQGTAVDAKRRLDQLLGKLSLESRSKMKGQGQVSDFEGRLLANAVSAIDRAAGPDVVKKHLQEIVDAFSGDAPNSGPNTPKAGGSSFRVVGVR